MREDQWSSYPLHKQIFGAVKARNTILGQALMEKHICDWISQIECRLKFESFNIILHDVYQLLQHVTRYFLIFAISLKQF